MTHMRGTMLSCEEESFGIAWKIAVLEVLAMMIEIEREEDGRWIAEIPDLSGVMTYGQTRDEAIRKAQALALRVLADRLEHGEKVPELS
jgi:predicted RNase H-like HicB family nuclease